MGREPWVHGHVGWRMPELNGYRDRLLAPQVGDVELRIAKLRQGSFFPEILQRKDLQSGR